MNPSRTTQSLALATAGAGLLFASFAWAFECNESPLFGVATGQTVRISILNTGMTKGAIIGPEFKVFDESGKLLADFTGPPLMAEQGGHYDYKPAGFFVGRKQIRVEVMLQSTSAQTINSDTLPLDSKSTIGSVEVFDQLTGRTNFALALNSYDVPTPE
jgi:hypothetical protein